MMLFIVCIPNKVDKNYDLICNSVNAFLYLRMHFQYCRIIEYLDISFRSVNIFLIDFLTLQIISVMFINVLFHFHHYGKFYLYTEDKIYQYQRNTVRKCISHLDSLGIKIALSKFSKF